MDYHGLGYRILMRYRLLAAAAERWPVRRTVATSSFWKVWLDCEKEANAQRVVQRVLDLAFSPEPEVGIEPYPKGGFVAQWTFDLKPTWSDAVVEAISLAQRLGTGWTLYGDVMVDPEGLLTPREGHRVTVPGVTMMSWTITRGG